MERDNNKMNYNRISNVLLIVPPKLSGFKSNLPEEVEEQRGKYPSLGLGIIASVLENNGNHIDYIDADALDYDLHETKKEISKYDPDLIGITANFFMWKQAVNTANICKEIHPDTPIVLGGPQATIYPRECYETGVFDHVVVGEGEYSILNLNKPIIHSKPIEDLDTIPFPARHLMPNEVYRSILSGKHFTNIITQRGCPYDCSFCSRLIRGGRRVRSRSPKNIVSEIEHCISEFGVEEISIHDDTFTIKRDWVLEICRLLIKRRIKIEWDCRTRVDLVDQKLLNVMQKAGCIRIHYGVESASMRILNILRKEITPKQTIQAFKWTKRAGVEILAYFMLGSPTETDEEIQGTIDFAKKLEPNHVHFSITTAFPATDLYQMWMNGNGIDIWREWTRNLNNEQPLPVFRDLEELRDIVKDAYREFYFRPKYILQQLWKTRDLEGIKRGIRGIKTLVKMK